MYKRIITKDILNSKTVTLTTFLFVVAASLLVSLAMILIVNLSGAIDTLMEQAKTPHFLQMHSGEINIPKITAFANQDKNVDDFQIIEFLNIDNSQIFIAGKSLANSVQDNGLIIQSKKFDYLLDFDGKPIQPSVGEIFLPVCYMQNETAKLGDRVLVYGKELIVAGFLRDSQMNSLLASSKRFLISQTDYTEFRPLGNLEYLIEFRLKNLSKLGEFEAKYVSEGFEANGPTITFPLFKTINAISDGLMIAVILMVSVLVILIAFMCIRFSLLAKIEDDYLEIGVMKAIGLRILEIKKIYLAKYAALAALACILGYALSFVFKNMLLENIRLNLGESANSSHSLLLGSLSVILVFLSTIVYVNTILNQFRKISPVEAIHFGVLQGKPARTNYFSLSRNKLLGINTFLGIKDVLFRREIYATMLIVIVISTFIVIVPQNLHNTISSNDFITYMGIGNCDLRFDIQQTDDISSKSSEISQVMESDPLISKFVVLKTHSFVTKLADGSKERLKVELGNHSIFPITYSSGVAPVEDNEIALSAANASELGKSVGDYLTLIVNGHEQNLIISGIYSDITNGGKTAKAVFSYYSADIMWSVISVKLADRTIIPYKMAEYTKKFPFAKISDIALNIEQTFGSTIRSIGKATFVTFIIALINSFLVTVLFMRMLIAKDRFSIAILKALGFSNKDISVQYLARSVFVLIIGILLGTLLANSLGEKIVGLVIAMFGASSFKFVINSYLAYLLSPALMIGVVLVATWIGTMNVKQIILSENIKE